MNASATPDLRDDFRHAMRRLGATVALITAGRPGDCAGMAATAVMSVTADPPTLAVAVNRSASLTELLSREPLFCVNLLAERHGGLVGVFSGQKQGMDRFDHGEWRFGEDGPPVLADAGSSLICRIRSTLDVTTHTLYVGTVEAIGNHPDIAPLLWVDGRMATVSPAR